MRLLEYARETSVNVQNVCVKVLFVCAFGMKPALLPGHRMATWRPSFVPCVCTSTSKWMLSVCVCVCLAGHEQCADDVKSPWVAFRRSPARSGNHPVYGPYVKTAQRRAHASSEDLTHKAHSVCLRHIFAILTHTLASK